MRMSKDYVLENLGIVKRNAVGVVPSLLEIRLFGRYQFDNYDEMTSDVDIMLLTSDESLSGLNFFRRDSCKRSLLSEAVLQDTGRKFKEREDLKLVSLFDMGMLIGRDNERGDIGRNMYKGELSYCKFLRNLIKLGEYLFQKAWVRMS